MGRREKKNVEKIMDFIIQKNTGIKLWIFHARADSADRKLYEKMRDAGVEQINFGIESGNQDVLDFYNKKLTLSRIQETVNLSNEMGFFNAASFILGAPIETQEHVENTIKFAKSIPLDFAVFYPFGYTYGSQLWEEAVNGGKIQPDEGTVLANSQRDLGNFTSEELMSYTMKAHRSFYLNPSLWMKEIYRAFTKKDLWRINLGLRMFIKR